MTDSKSWFEVDRKGLSKLLERRGGSNNGIVGAKASVIFELISNAWDPDGVTIVDVKLVPEEGAPKVWVTVSDDAPDGFVDLRQAWTLFAESNRKADATKRGRFNLGEKLVLALCEEASIVTTTGGVTFDHRGRTSMRTKRDRGSEFTGLARITRSELAEIMVDLYKLIPPVGISIAVNGQSIQHRSAIMTFEATLPTEIADSEGMIKRSARKCTVNIFEPLVGEVAMLYELGIPVVETGDKWHVEVLQKIPLNMNRDNVTPAFLKEVRTLVVNHMHHKLTKDDANATFVNEAMSDPEATSAAVETALTLKYGEKRAIFDATDQEANMNLVAQGYTLMHGSQLTKPQWKNVRKFDGAKPSGQIAPTKKALFSPDGEDRWVPRDKWTPAMHRVVAYTIDICSELVGENINVSILSDITQSYGACYGSMGFVYNLGRLGHTFFNQGMENDAVNRLIIHELGHHMSPNHLSEDYHEALCDLGAKFVRLALDPTKRKIFER